MHKNYTFEYHYKIGGKEAGTAITFDPTPIMDNEAGTAYLCMKIDEGNRTTVLPLKKEQIAMFEQAIAEFKRNVAGLRQEYNQSAGIQGTPE